MTIQRQPGTPSTELLQGLSHAKLLMVAQDLCIQRDRLIEALKETITHDGAVAWRGLEEMERRLHAINEGSLKLLNELCGPNACQCGIKQCDECPR